MQIKAKQTKRNNVFFSGLKVASTQGRVSRFQLKPSAARATFSLQSSCSVPLLTDASAERLCVEIPAHMQLLLLRLY